MQNLGGLIEKGQELMTIFGLKILAALVIFIVGRWIARFLKRTAVKLLEKNKIDPTLISFVGNLTYIALLTFVILAALSQLGVQTTSFIAVIGAAGLAIGLALQGSLANLHHPVEDPG
jgi:small conductance mechanosensitive channel